MSTAFLPEGPCRACDYAAGCLERDRGIPCRNFTNEYIRRWRKSVSEERRERPDTGANAKCSGKKRAGKKRSG